MLPSSSTHHVTLGVQGLVTDDRDRVLLVRHTYRRGWHFPGGGVERGETAEAALARELSEEAGVVLTGAPRLFGIYSNFEYFPGDHVALFHVTRWTRSDRQYPTLEIAGCRFFDRASLSDLAGRHVCARVSEVFDGATRSTRW